jgi:hypothetical protein
VVVVLVFNNKDVGPEFEISRTDEMSIYFLSALFSGSRYSVSITSIMGSLYFFLQTGYISFK